MNIESHDHPRLSPRTTQATKLSQRSRLHLLRCADSESMDEEMSTRSRPYHSPAPSLEERIRHLRIGKYAIPTHTWLVHFSSIVSHVDSCRLEKSGAVSVCCSQCFFVSVRGPSLPFRRGRHALPSSDLAHAVTVSFPLASARPNTSHAVSDGVADTSSETVRHTQAHLSLSPANEYQNH